MTIVALNPIGRVNACTGCSGTGIASAGQGEHGDTVCPSCCGFAQQLALYTQCELCRGTDAQCEACQRRALRALRMRPDERDDGGAEAPYRARCVFRSPSCAGPHATAGELQCLACFRSLADSERVHVQ